MNQNEMIIGLCILFIVVLVVVIYLMRNIIMKWDSNLGTKLHSYFQNLQKGEEEFIPSLNFNKVWKVNGEVIGELHLTTTGNNSKEVRSNMDYLMKLNKEHDEYCVKQNKLTKEDYIQ